MASHQVSPQLLELRSALQRCPEGPTPEELRGEVLRALEGCWDALPGSDRENTTTDKIHRADNLRWAPPQLSFELERHGGTVMGSSRADIHRWTVDVDSGIATCFVGGYVQVTPRSRPVHTRPIAQEIAALISVGKEDPRLKWAENRSRVRVVVGNIPALDGVNRTRAGRRERFRRDLETCLHATGWAPDYGSRPHTYRSAPSSP
jgi:hypothetical protein